MYRDPVRVAAERVQQPAVAGPHPESSVPRSGDETTAGRNRQRPDAACVGLQDVEEVAVNIPGLKTYIGHNIGSQAPISM